MERGDLNVVKKSNKSSITTLFSKTKANAFKNKK